ncbi:hypothetical protein IY145_20225 [Methylosinus sp. H3A]|uniref:hypothetical protein n=1 Tax=Methylosinus sp. H3A TaxID=2785786 RepID=UPI0018C2076D|nr:hypothetical protein [Methylosinus sp. H3A]MBG0811683.1 hypothetical protein [Methylosinus sp. H3A]
MRSNVAPSMRLLAGGLILAAAAADIGCAVAESRRSHGGGALIEELGAPDGKGFDDIVVKLAPLVASKPEKAARPAERPPAAALEAPTVAAAAPTPSIDSAKPAPAAPVFLREPFPIIESAPVEEIAKAREPDVAVEAKAEASTEPAPEAVTPAVVEAKGESQQSEAPVAEQAAPAPRAEEPSPSEEESESPLAVWQALVAALALVGLLAMKYVKRGPAPRAAESEPKPAKTAERDSQEEGGKAQTGRFAVLLAAIAAARANIEPIRAKIAALRGKTAERPSQATAATPKDAPKKPKTLDWTEVAAALRARISGAKATGGPAAPQPSRVIALVETEARGRGTDARGADAWEASEEDGPELLEPGDASARTIVMNARRRLRAAQS